METPTSPPPPAEPPPVAKKYVLGDYLFQFVTITAGVLIALLVNGFVELRNNRELVRDARANITLELAANKKEVDLLNATTSDRVKQIDAALALANSMLTGEPTTIRSLQLNFTLAELSSAAWRTAERTGALSHMDYGEVQRFSTLYDFQDLFTERQRELVAQVSEAFAMLSGSFDPTKPNLKDVELFRQQLLRLKGTHDIQGKLAVLLAEKYQALITP